MNKFIPDQIVRVSAQLQEQHALDSLLPFLFSFSFSFFETTFIYDQPERLSSGHMGFRRQCYSREVRRIA